MVRTRFAPSPSGKLHIGGARTALYNYLFAKKNNGEFILRFEDTDSFRSTSESVSSILDTLSWLNIKPDNNILEFQSQKINIYNNIARGLISKGLAYRCYCSEDRIRKLKTYLSSKKLKRKYDRKCLNSETKSGKFCIRIKVNPGKIIVNDILKGKVEFDSGEFEDFIIIRQNGMPTYNFACAVDDINNKITHVIRGDEHLINTPKQILIYKALGYKVPIFCHIPVILNSKTGKKMSKRDNGSCVEDLKIMGFNPEEILAYLCQLGTKVPKIKTFTIDEFINKFELRHIKTNPTKHSLSMLKKISKRNRRSK